MPIEVSVKKLSPTVLELTYTDTKIINVTQAEVEADIAVIQGEITRLQGELVEKQNMLTQFG
jgi:uncharacterized small protein (DUF1192 family)